MLKKRLLEHNSNSAVIILIDNTCINISHIDAYLCVKCMHDMYYTTL